jgi:glutamine synthetase type III
VTHFGKCIDEKTPLLRSMDAVKLYGLRLLKVEGRLLSSGKM